MKRYEVMLKEGGSQSALERAKQAIIAQGGIIEMEYTLIKGFTAAVPESVNLKSDDHFDIEEA